MHGPTGHNTQPHALLPPSVLGMDTLITSQLNVALIRKIHVRVLFMCLAYLLTYYPWLFVWPGTCRSTVAGIKCLYSTNEFSQHSMDPLAVVCVFKPMPWLAKGLDFTVPTFDSCTKYMSSPPLIHARTPGCYPVSWARMHWWPHNRTQLWSPSVGNLCFFLVFLTCHLWMFVQLGTGTRPVDWCRN